MKSLMFILIIGLFFSCNENSWPEEPAPSPRLQYTLTYEANGATRGSVPPPVITDAGSDIILSKGEGLYRDGYVLDGWNSNSNASGRDYAAGSNYTIGGDVTLYAKWRLMENNRNTMKITVGNTIFTATLATNSTAMEFKAMLPLTLPMSDFNNNEKVCSLPGIRSTEASTPGVIQTGDVMLYGSNSLVLFYETFPTTYRYTRIGRIDNPSALKAALGVGNITIKFELK